MPLNEAEVFAYVKHRLHVAGCTNALFDNAAIKKIHQLTGGIPRLINLLCERALMVVLANNKAIVNKPMIIHAAGEILPLESRIAEPKQANSIVWMYSSFAVLALLLGLGLSFIL